MSFSANPTNNRMQRIGDQIQRELAQLLIAKVNDLRLHDLSITAVRVSPDMANATIYVSVLDQKNLPDALVALKHASGFLRRELAHSLNLRVTPRLQFVYDESLLKADRLTRLINDITDDS
jgi:ribosome-binding factor A